MRFYIGRPVILGAMSISLFLAPVPHAQAEPAPSPVAAAIPDALVARVNQLVDADTTRLTMRSSRTFTSTRKLPSPRNRTAGNRRQVT
jgi:hypothetical protein